LTRNIQATNVKKITTVGTQARNGHSTSSLKKKKKKKKKPT